MHERAVDAAMEIECKKDCIRCSVTFSRHRRDSESQWQGRKYCSKKCSNIDTGEHRRAGRTLSDRFFEKVIKTKGCWEWAGCTIKKGYGRIGTDWGTDNASRVSWVLHNGPIPDGLHVLHKCDNPPCTNPEHLFLGTPMDNTQDKISKGRCNAVKGEAHPNAKLTGDGVTEIYSRYLSGEQMKLLAEEFGVTAPCVHDICWGRTWVDFTGAERIR